jgi:WD40 repeat protein
MTNLIALQNGTELVGDYRIERVLGAGGFGITYLADEIALARSVTIKEYFPSDFAARSDGAEAVPRSQDCAGDYKWGLERFIEEAQTLARFTHPNIVRVYRYFRANNTGYMVLHFEEGQSLKTWMKSLGRAPRQKELDAIVAPLLDALEVIHKGDYLHRDIAPDNIIIRKNGEPVLIDFGSARGEIASHSKTVSALVKPGYSPYEQYAETSRQQGPWTDIYALGATLYHLVSGKRPPDAPSRMVKDEMVPPQEAALAAYRPGFLRAINRALALPVEARPQSIAAWRGDLLAPEERKPSAWFGAARDKKAKQAQDREDEPVAAQKAAAATPPPPDVPGPQGGMLDFFEGLRQKTAPKEVQPPLPPPAAEPAAAAAAKPIQVSAPTAKLDDAATPRVPIIFRKESSAGSKKAPRPRPVRSSGKTWRPLLFKLLIGVGVASGAVAMQDRLPRLESRGQSVPSNQSTAVQSYLVSELKGHKGSVNALGYSSDGKTLITAGDDATIRVWNVPAATLTRTIELDDGAAISLAISGSKVLSGHGNGQIVLWDFERAEKIATFKRNDALIWGLTFVGGDNRFAAASHDWKVSLWDVTKPGAPVQVIDAHDSATHAIAFAASPKGPILVSGSADRTVKLWNLDTLDTVRRYRGHSDFVTSVAIANGGATYASGGLDGSIRLWSPNSSRAQRRLYGHRGRVSSLSFSPSGDTLASAGEDGQIRIWDFKRGRTAKTLIASAGSAKTVTYSPDGQQIASAGEDGIVRLWRNPVAPPLTN